MFGKGLGQSMQKIVVPEAQNDMIFSIICEELGLFGAISIMILFIMLIWRFILVAGNALDLYGALIVTGVITHISVQVVLNIAVVTNTIPNTGVTLPFISYGGSSVIILLAEIGIVLSVAKGSGKRFSFKSSK
jgi:cell division protein FtsW